MTNSKSLLVVVQVLPGRSPVVILPIPHKILPKRHQCFPLKTQQQQHDEIFIQQSLEAVSGYAAEFGTE